MIILYQIYYVLFPIICVSIIIIDNDIISDQSMRVLAKSCRDIQVLCLPGCSHISDQGLKALGHLKKLHVLNIADCTR